MNYSKKSYIDALKNLETLRDSVPEREKFAVEFIMEAVAEKCDREYPISNSDRVHGMSDEELSGFLAKVENRRTPDGSGAVWNGKAHAFHWLRQSIEDVQAGTCKE